MPLKLALFQPDIAQNTGTILRTAACLGVEVDIIMPCGFPFDDRKFKRAGMDYIDHVRYTKHASWEDFTLWHSAYKTTHNSRLILLTSKTQTAYTDITYQSDDVLLLGKESAGVPDYVKDYVDEKITIPMQPEMRSLNIAISGAIVASEAIRQLTS